MELINRGDFDTDYIKFHLKEYTTLVDSKSPRIEQLSEMKHQLSNFYDLMMDSILDEIHNCQTENSDDFIDVVQNRETYMTMSDVCEYLGVTRPTIMKYELDGLSFHQVTRKGKKRYLKSKVDEFIQKKVNQRDNESYTSKISS